MGRIVEQELTHKSIRYNKNTYIDGTCKPNKCNDEQNYNCDKKGCRKLGYKYKWDKKKNIVIKTHLIMYTTKTKNYLIENYNLQILTS